LAHSERRRFTLVLADAGHVKNVPRRKTDVNDATCLADLMADGLIRGSFVPDVQTQELRGLLRTRKLLLREALRGRVNPHHRFLLQLHLRQIDALDDAIGAIDREVDTHVEPFRTAVLLLTTISVISDLSAQVIRAEIGSDMSCFPTVGHPISWAGLCPRNDESAGRRRSNRTRKGAPWLKTTLIRCIWAAARKNASYLQAQFHRLLARRLDPHRRRPHAQ